MPLELTDVRARVVHTNQRKEGQADDPKLAVDVKIEVLEASEDDLAAFDPTLRSAFFRSDKAELRYSQMGPYPWRGEMKHMDLTMDGVEFHGCTFKKFVLHPYINAKAQKRVMIEFSMPLSPSGKEVALLAELFVQPEVVLTCSPDGALDLEPTTAGDLIEVGDEALYQLAVALVRETKRPSISSVQRHLQIGYNRAARLLERMEKEGVVTPAAADGKRGLADTIMDGLVAQGGTPQADGSVDITAIMPPGMGGTVTVTALPGTKKPRPPKTTKKVAKKRAGKKT